MTLNSRKAMSGVVVAMTIVGFISVGISLDAMINTVNNAFGTNFSPTAGTQASEFEATLGNICDENVDYSDTFRMSTANEPPFQIEFTLKDDKNGEDIYTHYQHSGDGGDDDINLYDDRINCGIVVDESQEVLNPGVTYTVTKTDNEMVAVQ